MVLFILYSLVPIFSLNTSFFFIHVNYFFANFEIHFEKYVQIFHIDNFFINMYFIIKILYFIFLYFIMKKIIKIPGSFFVVYYFFMFKFLFSISFFLFFFLPKSIFIKFFKKICNLKLLKH
ncbi:hypothetical protein EDEG_04012 [Edhazardia aedis USNM 41457]|uniref:Uncharacterized protein n=1 Tax=Edhazardia aedis (strain USNM 41457) TaxID=1003232 RepID=J8ZNU1_EDHAE|nr:hypothetical protein EDEG_04012 [Edhazardia aedis USNM 41457]|eukprot:EJW01358.1 hypothetical protein EDEG_04012 [Edhazardia aedis USNM 41457]